MVAGIPRRKMLVGAMPQTPENKIITFVMAALSFGTLLYKEFFSISKR